MIFKSHNSKLPLAFECTLVLLAISVFSFALQAKTSGYNGDSGTSASIRSMAKLSADDYPTHTEASEEHQVLPRFTWESLHFAAVALMQQGNNVPSARLSQSRSGPIVPSRYNLHAPDLMRRPPPILN
jgi:hypothetical protein